MEEQKCENCRYYSQHYSKQQTRFQRVSCGHCMNQNKKMKPREFCRYWEDVALLKDERKRSIKETLESMAKHLGEISLILRDDA